MYRFLLYFHTLRYLKAIQVANRVKRKIPLRVNCVPDNIALRNQIGPWVLPIAKQASLLNNNEFRFLNELHHLSSAGGWNHPEWSRLWLYNLHYFDDLSARDASLRHVWHADLIERWIQENPIGKGVGWEAYPLSLRIVNWIKWALLGNNMEDGWLKSLSLQAHYLSKRIEWHLLGNHLMANAKALLFSGLFFGGGQADSWLRRGLRILRQQLNEQVLSDGGHFERSTMYHSIILEDLLDIINITQVYKSEAISHEDRRLWIETAGKMSLWLSHMCHPDADIALFNDSALGIAAPLSSLVSYAERLGLTGKSPKNTEKLKLMGDSGYIRLEKSDATALIDVGEIGPDYLPGHAHADTLSFEMSLFQNRVFVNSGTSIYENGPLRWQQRSTASHNTVEINGESSSEVWDAFRVARRARPYGLDIINGSAEIRVQCSHDGYRRLPGKPVHTRLWELREGSMIIRDSIEGRFQEAVARYYFHPDIEAFTNETCQGGGLRLRNGRSAQWSVKGGRADLSDSVYYQEFGSSQANKCLEVRPAGSEMQVELTW